MGVFENGGTHKMANDMEKMNENDDKPGDLGIHYSQTNP
jgi:hypothetical protein